MDEQLQKALEFQFYCYVKQSKRILKEKYNEELVFYYNNGKFKATQSFLHLCSVYGRG